jgi:altronate dehydratase
VESLPQPARDRGARGYIGRKRAAVLEVRENEMGEAILDCVIGVANGEVRTKAELKGREDFIPWKRGVSL